MTKAKKSTAGPPASDAQEPTAHSAMDEAAHLLGVAQKARAKAEEASLAVEVNQRAGARALITAAALDKAATEAEDAAREAAAKAVAQAQRELNIYPEADAPKPAAPTAPTTPEAQPPPSAPPEPAPEATPTA